MKNILLVVALSALVLLSVTACLGEIKTYTDSNQEIKIGVKQEFIIALGAVPTTGYSWYASYDESIIELLEKRNELEEKAGRSVIGAGGVEFFRFRGLKKGEVNLIMTYRRPWEERIIDRKVFAVNIR